MIKGALASAGENYEVDEYKDYSLINSEVTPHRSLENVIKDLLLYSRATTARWNSKGIESKERKLNGPNCPAVVYDLY